MAKVFNVRFWNAASECIKVGAGYNHFFDSINDAWDYANFMLARAYKKGAVEIDINNDFFPIVAD